MEMSALPIDVTKLPNEILEEIFNHLDIDSLVVVNQVCQKWNAVVQRIHERAWKSINKAVAVKKSFLGPNYEERGWNEDEHSSIRFCDCIEIARDLVFYDDVELLHSDIELIRMKHKGIYDELDDMEVSKLKEVQAASRLTAAGILITLRSLHCFQIDLSSVKQLSHLVSLVDDDLTLNGVSLSSLLTVLRHVDCRKFEIEEHMPKLSEAEIKGLTEVLNSRVEKFLFRFIYEPFFPCMEHYDGRGKCQEIEVEYLTNQNEYEDDDERSLDWIDPDEQGYKDYKLDLEKMKIWSKSRGWFLSEEEREYDHLKTKVINIKRN